MDSAAIFLAVLVGILFIFLLSFIIINGNNLKELNNKVDNITKDGSGTDKNLQNIVNKLKEDLKTDEKNIQSNKDSLDSAKKTLSDLGQIINVNKDSIQTTKVDVSDLKKNYDIISSSIKDIKDIIKLDNFGLFTLTVVNDYSALQKNTIKTSEITGEMKNFFNKAKYFNTSNIVVVNNIKIDKNNNDIRDNDSIYSLGGKDNFVYKTYVTFNLLDNLKVNSNKLLSFTTKTGTLFIKSYVYNIPDVEGNEFIFIIITHSPDLYPDNTVLVQKNLLDDINSKVGDYLKSFKDPLITLISTLEQEYTEKFFSSFTFMKASDYKKIQGDLEILSSNTDIQLYNSSASNKFNSLYNSYKKGISIYKLKQPECRSIFLN